MHVYGVYGVCGVCAWMSAYLSSFAMCGAECVLNIFQRGFVNTQSFLIVAALSLNIAHVIHVDAQLKVEGKR